MKLFSILLLTIFCTTALWANEEMPAGEGTTSDLSVQAFSHPLGGLRGATRREFTVGNSFFQGVWVTSPASTTLRDGLGPLYNATSCSACHFKDGRGRGLPDEDGRTDISLLFRLREKEQFPKSKDPEAYGHQFNPFSIENVKGEGDSYVYYTTIKGNYADGSEYELKKPNYVFKNLASGELTNVIVSPRVGPQMIGLGLIENIPASEILKNADPEDRNQDGVRGRANIVYSLVEKKMMLGRFGWKAAQPSLLEQNAGAFVGDIGITSWIHPDEECTYVQLDCIANKTKDDVTEDILNKVTIYTQTLAVPVRRNVNDSSVLNGKKIFSQINCTSCHIPQFQTGNGSPIEMLNNQTIYPYSDFLLHDMGDDLADDKDAYQFEGLATAREFRTPPLWGVGMIEVVNGHSRLLHDGRARNVNEAILWHGGEASGSKEKYKKLSKQDREDLVKFVKSL